MRHSRLTSCSLFALFVALPGATLAQVDPNEPYIQSISYGGTGCPQGSVGTSFAPDRKSFTLIFDAFVASSGAGVPVTESRKNCQINLNLYLPVGFVAPALLLDYRGYASLPEGLTAERKSVYYFAEDTFGGEAVDFSGPVSRDYVDRDSVCFESDLPAARVVPLNLNAQVRLVGPLGSPAQITNDSIDGKIVLIDYDAGQCLEILCDDPDGDGVCGADDLCPGTVLPEAVPTKGLGVNHYVELTGDGTFESRAPRGRTPPTYTLAQTAGCSCTQIAALLGESVAAAKHGCAIDVMERWLSTL